MASARKTAGVKKAKLKKAPVSKAPVSKASAKKAPVREGPVREGAKTALTVVRDGFGPGAHAAGVDNTLKAANLKHLRRIEGQVRGLAGMVEQDRYCADIITQVSAVRGSLQSVARNLMRNHLQFCAAKAMHDPGMTREAMVDELIGLVDKLRT